MREDWEEVELGEVCFGSKGKKPPVLESKCTEKVNVPYINIKAFEKGIIDEYTDGEKCNLCEDGDLLMVWDGARAGLSGKAIKGAVGSTLMKIEEVKGIEKQYLSYFLLSLYTKINTNPRGVGIPHVEPRILWQSKLLILSSPIQRAIVSKIEALFSDLDNGIANFKKAQEQLKIYRQAVLKKAFEGELTKEWREKQNNLPTAEELLKQIKEERQNHYNQKIEDWKKAVKEWEKIGKKGSKPTKPQNLVSYPAIEQNDLLPILNMGELVTQISVKLMPDDAPNMPFIGMDCLEKNALKPHFTYKFNEFKSAGNWFNTNHILYGRMRPYLNKVYHAEYEGVASGEFIILETTKSILPSYLKLILHQQDFVYWSNSQSSGDKPRVKFEQIALYNIKVPSVQEQTQIVQEIESRLSVCDKMEQSISESLEKAEALRQSILKKAFEGKLLSQAEIEQCKQAADYEPASELIKKIKAEKLAKEQEKKKATTKKKSKK